MDDEKFTTQYDFNEGRLHNCCATEMYNVNM